MRKILIGLILLVGCADPQIGIKDGIPIRRHQIAAAGDPIMELRDGTVLMTARYPMYIQYLDRDNNGHFEKDTDTLYFEDQ